jgi:hypothetical protein
MTKPVPPEVVPCRKLLLAVADLHMRGYQRLRIMPYMGSIGAWRCVLAPAHLISSRHGAWLANLDDEFELPRYSGADGNHYWSWHDANDAPPARRARVFLDRFPQVAGQAYGPDWLYAGWFLHALHLTYPDALPTYESGEDYMSMYGRENHIPLLPPPGYAKDAHSCGPLGEGEDARD